MVCKSFTKLVKQWLQFKQKCKIIDFVFIYTFYYQQPGGHFISCIGFQ